MSPTDPPQSILLRFIAVCKGKGTKAIPRGHLEAMTMPGSHPEAATTPGDYPEAVPITGGHLPSVSGRGYLTVVVSILGGCPKIMTMPGYHPEAVTMP